MWFGRIVVDASGLAAASVVARRGVPSWDDKLFRRVNALPDWLTPIVWAPMQAGALGAPLLVGGALLATGRRREATRTIVTGVGAWALAKGVKALVGRGRPGDNIDDAILRMGSADNGLGFPSGHAAVVAALVAGARSDVGSVWITAGLALSIAVGASRIYVGAHYPLDVVGGYVLGALTADTYSAFESACGP